MINEAYEKGDTKILGAILGAPPVLSGLSELEHENFLRIYHERNNPELSERLNVVKEVQNRLAQSASIILAKYTNAIGLTPVQLDALRQGSKAAEDALIIKESESAGD